MRRSRSRCSSNAGSGPPSKSIRTGRRRSAAGASISNASPWPMSRAVTVRWSTAGAGRSRPNPPSTSAAMTAATARLRRRRSTIANAASSATGLTKWRGWILGRSLNASAAHRITVSGGPASEATQRAGASKAWARTAEISPRLWASAAAGAATRLAGNDASGTNPSVPSRIGATPSCAPTVAPTVQRTHLGPRRRATTAGASSSTPAVARTDKTNPSRRASSGSTNSSSITATASRRGTSRARPSNPATSTSAAVAPARSTEGCHRTSTTNHTSATNPIQRRPRAPTPQRAASPMTPASINAVCLPETTTRWARPAAANCSR